MPLSSKPLNKLTVEELHNYRSHLEKELQKASVRMAVAIKYIIRDVDVELENREHKWI